MLQPDPNPWLETLFGLLAQAPAPRAGRQRRGGARCACGRAGWCLSRAVGAFDVGPVVLAIPHIIQVRARRAAPG